MHSIAEAAQRGQNVPSSNISSALQIFEAAAAGQSVQAPAVPTVRRQGGAPMLPDTLRVPPPNSKQVAPGAGRAEVFQLDSENDPSPTAVVPPPAAPPPAPVAAPAPAQDGAPAVASDGQPAAAPAAPAAPAVPESRGWAEVKRAEAKNVADRKALAEREAKLEAAVKQFQTMAQQQGNIIDEVRRDPFAVLAKAGWTQKSLMDYAARVASGEAPVTPDASVVPQAPQKPAVDADQIIQKVMAYTADREYKADLRMELSKPGYELLRTYPNVEKELYNFCVKYAAGRGEILTPDMAARMLQDEYRDFLRTTGSQEPVRQVLGLAAAPTPTPAPAPQPAPAPRPAKPVPTTITNAVGTIPAAPPSWKDLPEHAKIAAVAQALPKDIWQ